MITHYYTLVHVVLRISKNVIITCLSPLIGVVDSSGLEFFYTNTRAMHEAGLLTVGHGVRPSMVIPPNADNYEVVGFCSGQCTEEVSIMCFPFVQKCTLFFLLPIIFILLPVFPT